MSIYLNLNGFNEESSVDRSLDVNLYSSFINMLSLRISDYYILTSCCRSYTVYTIHFNDFGNHMITSRRYSDFIQLDGAIRELDDVSIINLPGKKYFGNLEPSFILQRQQKLRNYINSIINNCTLRQLLYLLKFFGISNESLLYVQFVSSKTYLDRRFSIISLYNYITTDPKSRNSTLKFDVFDNLSHAVYDKVVTNNKNIDRFNRIISNIDYSMLDHYLSHELVFNTLLHSLKDCNINVLYQISCIFLYMFHHSNIAIHDLASSLKVLHHVIKAHSKLLLNDEYKPLNLKFNPILNVKNYVSNTRPKYVRIYGLVSCSEVKSTMLGGNVDRDENSEYGEVENIVDCVVTKSSDKCNDVVDKVEKSGDVDKVEKRDDVNVNQSATSLNAHLSSDDEEVDDVDDSDEEEDGEPMNTNLNKRNDKISLNTEYCDLFEYDDFPVNVLPLNLSHGLSFLYLCSSWKVISTLSVSILNKMDDLSLVLMNDENYWAKLYKLLLTPSSITIELYVSFLLWLVSYRNIELIINKEYINEIIQKLYSSSSLTIKIMSGMIISSLLINNWFNEMDVSRALSSLNLLSNTLYYSVDNVYLSLLFNSRSLDHIKYMIEYEFDNSLKLFLLMVIRKHLIFNMKELHFIYSKWRCDFKLLLDNNDGDAMINILNRKLYIILDDSRLNLYFNDVDDIDFKFAFEFKDILDVLYIPEYLDLSNKLTLTLLKYISPEGGGGGSSGGSGDGSGGEGNFFLDSGRRYISNPSSEDGGGGIEGGEGSGEDYENFSLDNNRRHTRINNSSPSSPPSPLSSLPPPSDDQISSMILVESIYCLTMLPYINIKDDQDSLFTFDMKKLKYIDYIILNEINYVMNINMIDNNDRLKKILSSPTINPSLQSFDNCIELSSKFLNGRILINKLYYKIMNDKYNEYISISKSDDDDLLLNSIQLMNKLIHLKKELYIVKTPLTLEEVDDLIEIQGGEGGVGGMEEEEEEVEDYNTLVKEEDYDTLVKMSITYNNTMKKMNYTSMNDIKHQHITPPHPMNNTSLHHITPPPPTTPTTSHQDITPPPTPPTTPTTSHQDITPPPTPPTTPQLPPPPSMTWCV